MNHKLNLEVAKVLGWLTHEGNMVTIPPMRAIVKCPDFSGNYETWQNHVAPELRKYGVILLVESEHLCYATDRKGVVRGRGSTVMEASCKALLSLKK